MGHLYDVDVYRHEDEDVGEPWWGAEGRLENSSVGVEFESTRNLAELISGVHDETIAFRQKWPDLQVRWLEGRQPATDFLAAAQARSIALPSRETRPVDRPDRHYFAAAEFVKANEASVSLRS